MDAVARVALAGVRRLAALQAGSALPPAREALAGPCQQIGQVRIEPGRRNAGRVRCPGARLNAKFQRFDRQRDTVEQRDRAFIAVGRTGEGGAPEQDRFSASPFGIVVAACILLWKTDGSDCADSPVASIATVPR